MTIPADYTERVYAGVLGKIIGVYLGRPIEGWTYERIIDELGETHYYVHEQIGKPLVVPDDDISGTFTFLRALPDYGNSPDFTPEHVGRTWLNYLVEERTVLWWGGLGCSTEHTAYLRLKEGIMPPDSGSVETNGRVVAEQIGAQIFIDGWGLVCPGDPEQAAEFARRAAVVSHDGEAVYGAQVVAALVAQAFVESNMDAMLDTAVSLIPADSTIAQVHADVREWAVQDGDWHTTRRRVAEKYGYDKFGGGCHMVPNHAVIVMALACAGDDFSRAIMIGNTAGWDTDCNVANIGCIMGVKVGLHGIEAGADWRGPVADLLYLPSADAGRVVSDAVREADNVVSIGCALQDVDYRPPKHGARYHFSYPGSVQAFTLEDSPECRGVATVENCSGPGQDQRSLAVRFRHLAPGRAARVGTPTFIPRPAGAFGYGLMASPTLHPGQVVTARVSMGSATDPVRCNLYVRHYDADGELQLARGPVQKMDPGDTAELEWRVTPTGGLPIAEVGVEVRSDAGARGVLHLDRLDWSGAPDTVLGIPGRRAEPCERAWVNGADRFRLEGSEGHYRIVQNEGLGLAIQGSRDRKSVV